MMVAVAKTRWLNRITVRAPHLTFCGSEKEYLAAVKHLKVKYPDPWLDSNSGARTHTFTSEGKVTCIICMDFTRTKDWDLSEIVSMLAHEATHVWQELCESIGERKPSHEFEAYSIQNITFELVQELFRRKVKYKAIR